jgi:uncharacterized protein YaeQ
MALKATIYKADLQIADMDRNYYQDHQLTLARHPSETDERMMVRLLAYARHAHEMLSFTKGLFDVDEPDLWQKDFTGTIQYWIEVGQPDDKRILKACGRAEQVIVYCYSSTSHIWWKQVGPKLERAKNLTVIQVPFDISAALAKLAKRNMQLQCTIQDGQVWINDGEESLQIEFQILQAAADAAY